MTAEQLEELLGKPVAWLYERKGFMPAVSQRKPTYTDIVSITPLYDLARRVIAAEKLIEKMDSVIESRHIIALVSEEDIVELDALDTAYREASK